MSERDDYDGVRFEAEEHDSGRTFHRAIFEGQGLIFSKSALSKKLALSELLEMAEALEIKIEKTPR